LVVEETAVVVVLALYNFRTKRRPWFWKQQWFVVTQVGGFGLPDKLLKLTLNIV
jgi:hypothetical protein